MGAIFSFAESGICIRVRLASMPASPNPFSLVSKRMRNRPNISDCHSCGRHVDHMNPKIRLRLLDSFWRIVLLCKKCLSDVRSGRMCAYCLKLTDKSCDLVECAACGCRVHKGCVRGFEDIASGVGYLGSSGEFGVCVDCWVPDPLRRSFTTSGKGNCEVKGKTLELNVTNELRGKILAKKTSNDGPAELVLGKEKAYACEGAENDATLAIHLHKEMNSSSRITKNCCSREGIIHSDGSRIGKWKGLTYERSRLGKKRDEPEMIGSISDRGESYITLSGEGSRPVLLVYKRDKQRKIWVLKNENVLSEESPCREVPGLLDESENGQALLCNGVNRWKSRMLQYRRDKKRKIWRLDDEKHALEDTRSSKLGGLEHDLDSCSSRRSIEASCDVLDVSSCYHSNKSNSTPNIGRFGQELLVYKRRTELRPAVSFMERISRDCLTYPL